MSNLKHRNLILTIVLYFLSFGIYPIYLYFKNGFELYNENKLYNWGNGLAHPILAFILSTITLGLYGIYNEYLKAKLLHHIGNEKNIPTFNPIIVMLSALIGISLIINSNTASKLA